MLILQDQEWLSIWEKCSFAHDKKGQKKNDDKSAVACGYAVEGKLARKKILSPMNVTIDRGGTKFF